MSVYVKTKPEGPAQGPFTRQQLKGLATSGQLKPHYLLSKDMKTWYQIQNVRGLLGLQGAAAGTAAEPATTTGDAAKATAVAPAADSTPVALEPAAAAAIPVAEEIPPAAEPAGAKSDLMATLRARPLLLALIAGLAGALLVALIVIVCLLFAGGNGESVPPPAPAVTPPTGQPTTPAPAAPAPPAQQTTPTPSAVTPPATQPTAPTPPAPTPPPTPPAPLTPPATTPPATTPAATAYATPATPSGPVVVPPPRDAPTPPPPRPNTKAEPATKPQALAILTVTYGGQQVQAMGSRLSFTLTNRTGLEIKSAKGHIRLYDPSGGYLAGLATEIDEPIKGGGTAVKEGVWMEVGGMILGMLNTSSKQMTFKFAAEEVAYTNGRTVSFK
jgi:hypothetical protein